MKISYAAPLALAVILLAACSHDSERDRVQVQDLAAGSYLVAVGNVDAPTVGRYYSGSDGSRLLALWDSDDHVNQIYRRNESEEWIAIPAESGKVEVTLLRSSPTTVANPDIASLAGRYSSLVSQDLLATYSIQANGDIVAGASACKLSGKLNPNTLPGTFKLQLSSINCGSLPASSTGVLTIDADDKPAVFRLTADDGAQVVDLLAFAE